MQSPAQPTENETNAIAFENILVKRDLRTETYKNNRSQDTWNFLKSDSLLAFKRIGFHYLTKTTEYKP